MHVRTSLLVLQPALAPAAANVAITSIATAAPAHPVRHSCNPLATVMQEVASP